MKVNPLTGSPLRIAGSAAVLLVCIATVPVLRSALSLREAASAHRAGNVLAETTALDRALLEAPPWAVPIRAAARRRLEALATGTGAEAWYAALSLVTAGHGADRARWQARCLEIVSDPSVAPTAMIPVDATPPSTVLAAASTGALVAWIVLAVAASVGSGHTARRAALAAAACWLLWLVTLLVA